jgi:hypothetical protein
MGLPLFPVETRQFLRTRNICAVLRPKWGSPIFSVKHRSFCVCATRAPKMAL